MALIDNRAQAAAGAPPETFHWLGVFGDALSQVEKHYLRPVDTPKLIQASLEGMFRSLDPHSSYISPATFSLMTGRTPTPAAIGISLTETSRGLRVIAALPNGPAARADIQPGDELVAIDGQYTSNLSVDQAVGLLKGEPASSVVLSIRRDDRLLDVTLSRQLVPPGPTQSSRMIGAVGYLSISALNENCARDAETAIRALRAQNPAMKGLVLDLRNSPGGLLSEAVGVADLFLDGGDIVSQRGREPRDVERYVARPAQVAQGLPMIVLVNGGTASGAEIIAGALQDRGRAKLLGLHTFGNGTIQTVIPLAGGRDGAIKLTTSMFFLPSGRPIQKVGLTPDLPVANSAAEAAARFPAGEAALPGAIDPPAGSPPAARPPQAPPAGYAANGDYQLDRAVTLLKG
ncbi:S41 family peptidase [Phenylobacterium sp.]|uniref:S41 family peptidase n=1 Tax=Phenylobacterium sp. TaxID=1871053 RepID=UPI0035686570